jgi:preprotein translocase subunit SecE
MWLKIGSALLLIAMLAVIWPRARQMLANSPKGSGDDWKSFVIIISAVALFVLLLIQLV